MPSLTEEMLKEIPRDFNIRWNFPICIESIDAKRVRLQCPPNSGSQYFNYKQYHSIILQAVVDANLKFETVAVGAFGKQRDGGVSETRLYQSLERRNLQVSEGTVLPHSEMTLTHILGW
jgi:hypothetical protein